MWISKRSWNEIQNRISALEQKEQERKKEEVSNKAIEKARTLLNAMN